MNKIPNKLRDEMAEDPLYQRCCVTGFTKRDTKIEWHHNLIFAGRQVQEKFAILPLAKHVHDQIELYRDQCDLIMLVRATPEELARYSKAVDLTEKRNRLLMQYQKRGGTYVRI